MASPINDPKLEALLDRLHAQSDSRRCLIACMHKATNKLTRQTPTSSDENERSPSTMKTFTIMQ